MRRRIIILMVLLVFVVTARAAQDGRGTNVFGHVRIKPGYGVTINGETRTNWPTESGNATNFGVTATEAYRGDWGDTVSGRVDTLNTSTNALNTRVGSLETATNALDTRVGSLETATNALNTRVGSLEGATNNLNANKLDRVGGVAVNLTSTNQFSFAPSEQFTITNNGALLPSDKTYRLIASDTGDKTVAISNGFTPGQMLILVGNSTNTVTITNNPGVVELLEAVDFTFASNNLMHLIWSGTKWTELNRAAKQ